MLTDITIAEKTRSTICEDMVRCDSGSDCHVTYELGYRDYCGNGGYAVPGSQK